MPIGILLTDFEKIDTIHAYPIVRRVSSKLDGRAEAKQHRSFETR